MQTRGRIGTELKEFRTNFTAWEYLIGQLFLGPIPSPQGAISCPALNSLPLLLFF
jgi:hypothetical protein